MNILITLPDYLIGDIILGKKTLEMRKCLPKHMKIGEDGFFVVEKGTDCVLCWCRVDNWIFTAMDYYSAQWYAYRLCVSPRYIMEYTKGEMVYLWKIGKVKKFYGLKRDELHVDKNPQQFAYCPLSYGESF